MEEEASVIMSRYDVQKFEEQRVSCMGVRYGDCVLKKIRVKPVFGFLVLSYFQITLRYTLFSIIGACRIRFILPTINWNFPIVLGSIMRTNDWSDFACVDR